MAGSFFHINGFWVARVKAPLRNLSKKTLQFNQSQTEHMLKNDRDQIPIDRHPPQVRHVKPMLGCIMLLTSTVVA